MFSVGSFVVTGEPRSTIVWDDYCKEHIMRRFFLGFALLLAVSTIGFAQNTNSSTTTKPRPRTTNSNSTPTPTPKTTASPKPATTAKTPAAATPGSEAVLAAFNKILDGIRHANVDQVTAPYWNSKQLILFNNNGTVTRGWDQMHKNRESSYPELKDVKLDVRDIHVTMLGRGGALVTCLWNQTQTYKGATDSGSGRMTLVFKRIGTDWKAVHLHTSPDAPNPARVLPSEQQTSSPTTPAKP
jgi:hypothetical protein